MITKRTSNNIVMKNKDLIPWCECTFMDVDMNTIHPELNTLDEISIYYGTIL